MTFRHASSIIIFMTGLLCCAREEEPASHKSDNMNVEEAIYQVSKDIGLTLKPKQLEAVTNFCNGKDVFVSFPTGYGKSRHRLRNLATCF